MENMTLIPTDELMNAIIHPYKTCQYWFISVIYFERDNTSIILILRS